MSLRAMEPQLPAPPEALMDQDELDDALVLAKAADGILPHFLAEQLPDADAFRQLQEKCDAELKINLIALGLAKRNEPPRRRFK